MERRGSGRGFLQHPEVLHEENTTEDHERIFCRLPRFLFQECAAVLEEPVDQDEMLCPLPEVLGERRIGDDAFLRRLLRVEHRSARGARAEKLEGVPHDHHPDAQRQRRPPGRREKENFGHEEQDHLLQRDRGQQDADRGNDGHSIELVAEEFEKDSFWHLRYSVGDRTMNGDHWSTCFP